MPEPVYLGDSVYVRIVDGMLELTTRNGLPDDPGNTIYLDLKIYKSLVDFVSNNSLVDF